MLSSREDYEATYCPGTVDKSNWIVSDNRQGPEEFAIEIEHRKYNKIAVLATRVDAANSWNFDFSFNCFKCDRDAEITDYCPGLDGQQGAQEPEASLHWDSESGCLNLPAGAQCSAGGPTPLPTPLPPPDPNAPIPMIHHR
jgi:hypothetical protein